MALTVHAEQEELRRALGLEPDNMLISDGDGDPKGQKVDANAVVCRIGTADIDGLVLGTNGFLARLGSNLQDFSVAQDTLPLRGSGNLAAVLLTDSEVVGIREGGNLGSVTKVQQKDILDVNEYISKSSDHTVLDSESGRFFVTGGADVVFTLPATAAGLWYTFMAVTLGGSVGLSISPNASDKIIGAQISGTATDDKDVVNTAATDVVGDMVHLVGDGADGWFLTVVQGIWARE